MVFRPNPYDPRLMLTQEDESSSITLNVTATGNDESGDGSSANPFLTLGRALEDISIRSQYSHTIQIGAGTFTLPNDAQLFAQDDFLFFKGTKTIELSEEVLTVVTGTQAAGLRVRVTGAPGWTPNEHIGKLIQWTSGAASGKWGVIYDNDADSIWMTTDETGVYAGGIPGVNSEFDIYSLDTTIQVNTNVGALSSKLRFEELQFSGTATIATQSSGIEMRFCSVDMGRINAGHASIIFLNRCYVKGSAFVINSAENAAISIQRGCVLDGDLAAGLSLDQGTRIFFSGEVVFARLDATGITCRGISLMSENANATMRFYDSVAGFIDKAAGQSIASLVNLPFIAGNITGAFAISSDYGSRYIFAFGGTVSTSSGNNVCTVNATNESYFRPNFKTRIHGSGNTSDNTIAADATTVDVSFSKCEGPIWTTSANTGGTAITNFTNGFEGQRVIIKGGSSTNATTIADGGNYELAGGVTITFNADVKAEFRLSNGVWEEMWRRAA